MARQKAATGVSGSVASKGEDIPKLRGHKRPVVNEARDEEPPLKKARGRPKVTQSNTAEISTKDRTETRSVATTSQAQEATRPRRRGRPKGSRGSTDGQAPETTNVGAQTANDTRVEDEERSIASNDELDSVQDVSKPSKPKALAAKRGRGKASGASKIMTDGEFKYTPKTSRQVKSPAKSKDQSAPTPKERRKAETKADNVIPETQRAAPEVDETILEDELVAPQSVLASPTKSGSNRLASLRALQGFPSKRKLGDASEAEKPNGEPELRRKLGDLTKRYDALESKYRDLKEIGIVEANANMDKLRKQCEAITAASNELVASLKAELETQRALGLQTRALQKQLKERDTKVARLESRTDELTSQLSSAQSEVKALQTKLAAARNKAVSIESAAAKVPGSAIKKNTANRANAAASAEVVQAAQIAQLKEDLYSDLTGLIIRDIKQRDSDNLYDCIQTGANGTLHFKLAVPQVTATNFESAEFQYIPLLDENRDRDLVDILPEYLTVDITFSRRQAANFYTRVIDALTKRPVDADE